MFVLVLNDMRSPKSETLDNVAKGTREELIALYRSERVEVYRDGKWHKVFRKGGPLEWFNRAEDEDTFVGPGIGCAGINEVNKEDTIREHVQAEAEATIVALLERRALILASIPSVDALRYGGN
jgi:hypothetical protein